MVNLKISKGYDEHIVTFLKKSIQDYFPKDSFYPFDFTVTTEWGEVGRAFKYASEPLRYALFDGEKPIGLFQGIVQRKFIISTLVSGEISGNGVVVHPAYEKEALKFFISEVLKREKFSSTSIYIPKNIRIPRFSTQKKYTYYIDLRNPLVAIMSNMKKQCRWAIRKAQKNQVQVEISDLDDMLEEAYYIVSQTANAKNLGVPPLRWIQELHNKFKTCGHSISAIARHDREPVSAGYFLGYDKKLNWFIGGSKPEGYKLQAGNLVQMKVIEWAKNHGYKIYDMGGTHPYDPRYARIDKFKSSFGGALITNYRLYQEKVYMPFVSKIRSLIGY